MHFSHLIPAIVLLGANTIQASVLAERAVLNGPCTGSGGAPGVCIPTTDCTAGGGTHILNACPGTPDNVRCCTKTSCGTGGNCRFTSQCSTSTLTGLCPGPADFKCCVPGGTTPLPTSGPYPPPAIPAVGACKAASVSGSQKVVAGNPGKVRQIYCTRDCSCPGTSDHCCGLAIDFMCSSAGGVSALLQSAFPVASNMANTAPRSGPILEHPSRNGSWKIVLPSDSSMSSGARRSGILRKTPSSPGRNGVEWRTEAPSLQITGLFFILYL
jgi:hypothetical protein